MKIYAKKVKKSRVRFKGRSKLRRGTGFPQKKSNLKGALKLKISKQKKGISFIPGVPTT